jgi:hypothetical protein
MVLAEHLQEEAMPKVEEGFGFSFQLQRAVLCWNLLLEKWER